MRRQTSLYEIDVGKCVLCNKKGNVMHHISYFPEIKIRVCSKCHGSIRETNPELSPLVGDYQMFIQTFDGSEDFERYGVCNIFAKVISTIPKKVGVTTDTIIKRLVGDTIYHSDYYQYFPHFIYSIKK